MTYPTCRHFTRDGPGDPCLRVRRGHDNGRSVWEIKVKGGGLLPMTQLVDGLPVRKGCRGDSDVRRERRVKTMMVRRSWEC